MLNRADFLRLTMVLIAALMASLPSPAYAGPESPRRPNSTAAGDIRNVYDDLSEDGVVSAPDRQDGLTMPDAPDSRTDDDAETEDDQGPRAVKPEPPAGCMFRDEPLELIV